MASVWANGRMTAVFHRIGTDPVTNEPRYRRANFDFLEWDSDGDGVAENYINTSVALVTNTTEIQQTGQESDIGLMFGAYREGFEIVDVSNPGENDTWRGLHSIGYY